MNRRETYIAPEVEPDPDATHRFPWELEPDHDDDLWRKQQIEDEIAGD